MNPPCYMMITDLFSGTFVPVCRFPLLRHLLLNGLIRSFFTMLPYFLSERSIMTFFSRKHLRLLLLPALLLLTGCAGSAKETADSTENEKLSAVATIFPQYDFLRAIGGDHLDLHMLLSPGAESHSFEPTPGDMITVSECDLFVYVGGDSDAWVRHQYLRHLPLCFVLRKRGLYPRS